MLPKDKNRLNFFSAGLFKTCGLIMTIFALIPTPSFALNQVGFQLAHLHQQNWHIQGIKLVLNELESDSQQLQLSIAQLQLPPPFTSLNVINIRCPQFNWDAVQISCSQGSGELKSSQFKHPRFKFSFQINPTHSYFKLQQLQLLKGEINVDAYLKKHQWQLKLNGKQIEVSQLKTLLADKLDISAGQVNIAFNAEGNLKQLQRLGIKVSAQQLSLQTKDATQASELLDMDFSLDAKKWSNDLWLWQTDTQFKQGSLYIQPLFLHQEPKDKALTLTAQGAYSVQKNELEIDEAIYQHPSIGTVKANALIKPQPFKLLHSKITGHLHHLERASQTYLDAFTQTSVLEGITLKGRLDAQLDFHNNQLTELNLIANAFKVTDAQKRINLDNGSINFNWSNQTDYNKASYVHWQQLELFSIPMDTARLKLLFKQKQGQLLNPAHISVLNGDINIQRFDWQTGGESPSVHFSGKANHLSLEKLAQALGWNPLSGHISGHIPSVEFNEGLLELKGGLKINVFDGEINIKKLALSGLIKGFPRVYSTIRIKQLDLGLLTQRFEFGNMSGRLSGHVTDLYLENWKPVQFYAWFGTPKNDDSDHKISQKAVENLASIGGGGAIDYVSRLILGVFDNFDYEAMGLGCYLHQGVCQLMGVEAAGDRGYYIVKGGGIPQINVMGYNTRVDWDVLWERLSRISTTDNAIVE